MTSDILIYSLGSIWEKHGPALRKDNDDLFAQQLSLDISAATDFRYRGHLPYASDHMLPTAHDYVPYALTMDQAFVRIAKYINDDKKRWYNAIDNIILVSGHGGYNFLKKRQKKMSSLLGVNTLYIEPYGTDSYNTSGGPVDIIHAGTAEHSVAAYMGVLNTEELERLNKELAHNTEETIRKWPEIGGLAGYVLYGGERFSMLATEQRVKRAEQFRNTPIILANTELGKELYDMNLERAIMEINKFLRH